MERPEANTTQDFRYRRSMLLLFDTDGYRTSRSPTSGPAETVELTFSSVSLSLLLSYLALQPRFVLEFQPAQTAGCRPAHSCS